MNDKLKFYRSTLVQMTKEAYRKMPKELKTEEAVEEGELLTKAIMKKVDEFEVAVEQHFNLDKERVNYYFGGDNCVAKDFTCTDPNFFKGVNPDYLKTEPIRTLEKEKDKNLKPFLDEYDSKHFELKFQEPMKTIVDNGSQYQANQKPYGTLGEHWKELMNLFNVKGCFGKDWKDIFIRGIDFCKNNEKKCSSLYETFYEKIKSVADKLGVEFIEDFVKACEKCEE